MIEIEHDKKAEMSECCEKILRYGGKLMQCIEDLGGESSNMGNRVGYRQGVRGTGRYGIRGGMGMRDDDMDYREPSHQGMMGYRDPYYY